MEKKQMKAIFVNGSPRKNKNTADMRQSAMRGAQEMGAECELVNLYDLDFLQHLPVQRLLALRLQPLQRRGQAQVSRRTLRHRPSERLRTGQAFGAEGRGGRKLQVNGYNCIAA